jgi:hypothetical protein
VRTPDEVELRVTKITPEGVMRLEWDWPVGTDGVHVTRGLTRDLPLGDYGNCIATDFTARLFYDWYVPPAGQCLTYLVHAESAACGVGSLGRMSNGAERVNTNLARCP